MTSPERLKRRQLIEGALLILLGIGMIVQTAYFQNQDDKQKACIAKAVSDQNTAFAARADIAERQTELQKLYLDPMTEAARLVQEDPQKALDPEEQKRLNAELVDGLLTYEKEIVKLQQEREDNPVPEFSDGECD